MSADLQIAVSQEQGRVLVTVLSANGEIGAHNYQQLQDQANEAIATGASDLLLNLTHVTYMSSAGLRAVHAIYKKLEGQPEMVGNVPKAAHFKLLNPPEVVLKVIKALGFDMFLEIYTDLAEAVASF